MENNDFGFSLVSEQELKENEELLRQKVNEQSKFINDTSSKLTNKLHGLRDMIMPLLDGLSQDPEKTYILWPNRVEKIKEFIEKMDNYVDN